jgi:hypothetical protein
MGESVDWPVATGVLDYFPDALKEVAKVSKVGNDQHNPGTALHWDRAKSQDEDNTLISHFLRRGTLDSDGMRHSAKVAWRALAALQKEIERDRLTEKAVASVSRPDTAQRDDRRSAQGRKMGPERIAQLIRGAAQRGK